MRLEAFPGDAQGREWIVVNDARQIVATFHPLTYDGGEAQFYAEYFAAQFNLYGIRKETQNVTTASEG